MNILLLLLIVSLLGTVHILILPPAKDVRKYALSYSIVLLLLSMLLWYNFDSLALGFQYNLLLGSLGGIHYNLAVDGISLWFIVLTSFLMPLCVLISWESITYRVKEFYALLLLITFLLYNVFAVLRPFAVLCFF